MVQTLDVQYRLSFDLFLISLNYVEASFVVFFVVMVLASLLRILYLTTMKALAQDDFGLLT